MRIYIRLFLNHGGTEKTLKNSVIPWLENRLSRRFFCFCV